MIFCLGLVSPLSPRMTIRSAGAHCKSSPHGRRRKLPRTFGELLLAIYPPTSRGRLGKLRNQLQDRCHQGLALRHASRYHDDRRAMLRPRIRSSRRGPMRLHLEFRVQAGDICRASRHYLRRVSRPCSTRLPLIAWVINCLHFRSNTSKRFLRSLGRQLVANALHWD